MNIERESMVLTPRIVQTYVSLYNTMLFGKLVVEYYYYSPPSPNKKNTMGDGGSEPTEGRGASSDE
jgi:hypothetical protein